MVITGRARHVDVDAAGRQSRIAVLLGDVVAERAADGPVGVEHLGVEFDAIDAAVYHIGGRFQQKLIQMILQSEILRGRSSHHVDAGPHVQGVLQQQTEVQHAALVALRVQPGSADPQQIRAADEILKLGETQLGHLGAHVLGQQEEVVDQVLGLPCKFLAQDRVLGGDPHRARVQVALAHHRAAQGDQRRRAESELVRSQQRSHQDVESRTDLTIRLKDDPGSQVV